jgi:hypothetical protein
MFSKSQVRVNNEEQDEKNSFTLKQKLVPFCVANVNKRVDTKVLKLSLL